MRAVIQRVSQADVKIDNNTIGSIGKGLLILLAIHVDDSEDKIERMANKIIKLRIFEDENGKMNRSLNQVDGELLVVSQFTLYGDVSQGNRPGFTASAKPDKAIPFYEKFVSYIREQNIKVETGSFGAYMMVGLVNQGPTTIIIDL